MLKSLKGASLVEYGLLVGLIAVVAIAAVAGLGQEVKNTFESVEGSLQDAINDPAAAAQN